MRSLAFVSLFSLGAMVLATASAADLSTAMTKGLPESQLPGLKALLETAVSQSPSTLTASIEVSRLEAQKMVDESTLWPSLYASTQYGGFKSSTETGRGIKSSSRNTGFFYTLSFYQPIFHFGALKAQADAGKVAKEIAERRFEEAYRTLALALRARYLEAIKNKKAALNAARLLQTQQGHVAALEQRFAAGALAAAELNEPRLELAEARITAERLEEAFLISLRAVAALAGEDTLSAESIPNDFPKLALTQEETNQLLAAGSHFDPLLTPQGQALQGNLRQTDLNYKVARVRTLPKFNLTASASENNNTDTVNGAISQAKVSTQNVGISANWQIFDGFAARGTKLALKQQRRSQELLLSDYQRTSSDRVQSLRKQVQLALRSLEIVETRFEISKLSVSTVEKEVNSGHSSADALKTVTERSEKAELLALASREAAFALIAEYLSLVGQDPALQNLSTTTFRHARP